MNGSSAMVLTQMPPLSPKQEVVLKYLYRYFEKQRYFPTHREIMDHLGVKGATAVSYLVPLETKGYITREKGIARNIVITDLGIEKLELLGVIGGEQTELFS